MKILGLDFETTGLKAGQDRVIEVGAVIWDTETKKPLTIYSELVKPEGFIGLSAEIHSITGIDDQTLYDYGIEGSAPFEKLLQLISGVDYVVAHNASFDKSFLDAELAFFNLPKCEAKWLDTLTDVPYRSSIQTRKLDYLAAEHKVLNPFSHRAVFDVLTMLNVLDKYDIESVVQRSKSPNVEVTALVSFEEKDKAKNLGFRWDGKTKRWFKDFKACDIETTEFPFKVDVQEKQMSLN